MFGRHGSNPEKDRTTNVYLIRKLTITGRKKILVYQTILDHPLFRNHYNTTFNRKYAIKKRKIYRSTDWMEAMESNGLPLLLRPFNYE